MSSWRSGRGLQWQHVKLWWTPCSRGLRQCWKIMVATQNIDTLWPIWTFSLMGVLTFVASGLDINGYVLSYFEGTANLHCYTSCTLTTLHCSKVSFLQCSHMKRYNKIFTNMWGVYSLLWDTPSICLSVCLHIFRKHRLSVYLLFLIARLSVYLSIHQTKIHQIHQSKDEFFHPSKIYQSYFCLRIILKNKTNLNPLWIWFICTFFNLTVFIWDPFHILKNWISTNIPLSIHLSILSMWSQGALTYTYINTKHICK